MKYDANFVLIQKYKKYLDIMVLYGTKIKG